MKKTFFQMIGACLVIGALATASSASVPLRLEIDNDSQAVFETAKTKVLRVSWGVYQEC